MQGMCSTKKLRRFPLGGKGVAFTRKQVARNKAVKGGKWLAVVKFLKEGVSGFKNTWKLCSQTQKI